MRKIKSKGTGPEKLLLDAIRRLGGRPRRYVGTLPGKPDFVFHKERLACFVDGEYWHGVQWRRRRLNFLAEQFSDAAKKDAWLAEDSPEHGTRYPEREHASRKGLDSPAFFGHGILDVTPRRVYPARGL